MSAKRIDKKLKAKKRVERTSSKSWLLVGLGLTGLAMLSATTGALLALSLTSTPLRQNQLSAEEEAVFNQEGSISYANLQLPQLTRPVNIVVLGTKVLTSDLKDNSQQDLGYHALVNSFEGLSDTMLLVRFDPVGGRVTVLSIPRDTKAFIEGHGVTKINAANDYGGPALAAQTVSNLLEGISIDRYVRVNVQGVEKLIDALGGVTVNVPKDMKYNDFSQHLYINLKAGKQHLNGEQAVQFLRFRYDRNGDIGRVQRQHMFMRALGEQILQPQVVMRMPKIISVIKSNVDTNLTVEELLALSGFAAQTKRSNVQMLMLPGRFNGDGRHEISYWLPDSSRIRDMMARYFDHSQQWEARMDPIDPTRLNVAIQDSTGDTEAVGALVQYLREAGYRSVYISEEKWSEPLSETRIVAQQGDLSGAAAVRGVLEMGEILVESTGTLTSDITIQVGRDWLPKSIALKNAPKTIPVSNDDGYF